MGSDSMVSVRGGVLLQSLEFVGEGLSSPHFCSCTDPGIELSSEIVPHVSAAWKILLSKGLGVLLKD